MNDEKQMITIDGKEYDYDELENNEQYLNLVVCPLQIKCLIILVVSAERIQEASDIDTILLLLPLCYCL